MDEIPASNETAAHACVLCKKNKRRCDKSIPSCSMCLRMHRTCDYSEPAAAGDDLRSRVQELEELVAQLSTQTPPRMATTHLPPIDHSSSRTFHMRSLFLDSDVLEFCNVPHVITPNVHIPTGVSEILRDQPGISHIIRGYLGSVNTWMPVISKAKLDKLVDGAQNEMRADLVLLLLTMKLVQEVPRDDSMERSSLYITAKRFNFELEMADVSSLAKVQAGLLIVIYELGHALFPAAYASIGNCIRQGVVLGIHDSLAPQLLPKPRSWLDWEERLRVWWLIVVLDRYSTSGGDHRPLCTEDPAQSSHIPADDAAWNGGDMVPPERLFQSSSTSIPVSPFARLAQASNMLGRVIRHCNNITLPVRFALEDIVLLSQTTSSLLALLIEDPGTTVTYNVAAAICFSALMKISENHSCDSFPEKGSLDIEEVSIARECTELSLRILRETACQIVSFVQVLEQHIIISGMNSLSPLLLHCIYRAAVTMLWMATQCGDERYTTGKNICMRLLERANIRWRAAGVYLEAFRVMQMEMGKDVF